METIWGTHPVIQAIKANRRKFTRIFVPRGSESKFDWIRKEAIQKKVVFESADPKWIQKNWPEVPLHQSVFLECSHYPYIDDEGELFSLNRILMLDEVQDTQNLGALSRSAYLFGFDGIIVPKLNSAPVTEVVCRASAGAIEHLKVARVSNLANIIEVLKEHHYWIYGADMEGAKDVQTEKYPEKAVLVMGSEGKGLRRLVKERCDILLKIPTLAREVDSLNVSVAGGIFMWEMRTVR